MKFSGIFNLSRLLNKALLDRPADRGGGGRASPHRRAAAQGQPSAQAGHGEAAITPELSLLPTPGHTPGHCSVAVASAGETAIILGDVAHHPLHLECIWIAAVDELPRVSRRTKRALTERLIEEHMLVAAGHFASGSFGRMVRADGQRRWQPL
ncbi:MAG: hypothetical protein IIC90_02530 [Chloroflexi bacterium]|nr:hypothetical protein [Chloroflexota bacterium]